jgi:hypothetical protein
MQSPIWRFCFCERARALHALGLGAIHCIATTRSSPDISRSSVCFDQRWLWTTFRSGAQAFLPQIASRLCGCFPAHPPVRQIVQFPRDSAHCRSGSAGHPPAGLMAECTAEQSLGCCGTLPAACLVHRRSVVMPNRYGLLGPIQETQTMRIGASPSGEQLAPARCLVNMDSFPRLLAGLTGPIGLSHVSTVSAAPQQEG